MRLHHAWLFLSLLGLGCDAASGPGLPARAVPGTADAGALGGLPDDLAGHPSVQLARPAAYVLTAEGRPFLLALERVVAPRRATLAQRLAADEEVAAGLAGWARASTEAKMDVLARVAAVQGEVMGCEVPRIARQPSFDADADLMAAYEPPTGGDRGTITLYPHTLAQQSRHAAVAIVVHEMCHAAQRARLATPGPSDEDRTLAAGYAAAWQASTAAGGQGALAYGDYVHLTVEHDAFQTGNFVAARLAGLAGVTPGLGFVTSQYDGAGRPAFDVLGATAPGPGPELVAAVNRAQAAALGAGRFVPHRPGGRGDRRADWGLAPAVGPGRVGRRGGR
ncbi:MAG: hypothetical protein VKS61_16840 [Candidatus Sericytochromatia bacterium]|nr:hypothetical protein [Candidatus Sericytochromatia bacterium]